VLADADSDGAQANDGQYNGAYLAKDAYLVQAIALSVLKSSQRSPIPSSARPRSRRDRRIYDPRDPYGRLGSAAGVVITDAVPATTARWPTSTAARARSSAHL